MPSHEALGSNVERAPNIMFFLGRPTFSLFNSLSTVTLPIDGLLIVRIVHNTIK